MGQRGGGGGGAQGYHEAHDLATVRATVLEQLGRLGLDYIDLCPPPTPP